MNETENPEIGTLTEIILKRDRMAETAQPEVLQGLPVFRWEDMISGIDENQELFSRLGLKDGKDFLKILGSGQDGVVVRMRLGDKDWAVKLYYSVGGLGEKGKDAMQNLCGNNQFHDIGVLFTEPEINDYEDKYGEQESRLQAAAWVLGHEIAPDWIEAPIGLISVRGKAGGLIMPYIEGVPKSPLEAEVKFGDVIQKLERGGVAWDSMYDRPNLVEKSDGSWRLLDLGILDSKVLESDPRHLREGEYFREVDPTWERDLPFDRSASDLTGIYLTIEELEKRIYSLEQRHLKARGDTKSWGFKDLIDGKVVITEQAEFNQVVRADKTERKVREWIESTRGEGLSDWRMCLSSEDDDVIVMWKKGKIENQLEVEIADGEVGFDNFRYVRQDYTGNGGKTLVVEKNNGAFKCRLSTYDRSLRKELEWEIGVTENWDDVAKDWGLSDLVEKIREIKVGDNEEEVELVRIIMS